MLNISASASVLLFNIFNAQQLISVFNESPSSWGDEWSMHRALAAAILMDVLWLKICDALHQDWF